MQGMDVFWYNICIKKGLNLTIDRNDIDQSYADKVWQGVPKD